MRGKETETFIRLQHDSLDLSKILQTALTFADFFWKGGVLRWVNLKNNAKGYTENENKLFDL